MTVWYLERSAGIVAYLLLSSTVLLGLGMSARWQLTWPRFAVEELHRYLSILAGTFIALHGLGLLLDNVVSFSLIQVLVPFTSSYRPLPVALGILSAELLAAVAVTNRLRSRIGHKLWRRVHYLTLVVWLGTTAHLLLTGTDRQQPWLVALVAVTVTAVSLAFAARVAGEVNLRAGAAVLATAMLLVVGLAFVPEASSQPPPQPAAAVVASASPTA